MMEATWTRIFQNGILLISVLVLFFLIDVHVGLIMTASALVALLLLMALRSRGIPLWLTLRQMSATFFGFLSEQLVAIEDIRANGAT
jgi:ATP-binding cassette, subfamily B, bacterial